MNATVSPDVADAERPTVPAANGVVGIAANEMVWAFFAIVKTRVTFVAALHFASPACEAVTEQRPAATSVNTLPETVQMVAGLAAKATGRAEDEVPTRFSEFVERVVVGGAANVMVWATLEILNELVSMGAAEKTEFPLCVAAIVQSPAAKSVTVFPETVQIVGVCVAKDTLSPDVEVAEIATVGVAKVWGAIVGNMMSCFSSPTANVLVTDGAGCTVEVPAWLAVMEQVPTDRSETVSPETEHTTGVLLANETVSPADEVAATVNAPKLIDRGGSVLKVMTCVGFVIVKLRFTAGADAYCAFPT